MNESNNALEALMALPGTVTRLEPQGMTAKENSQASSSAPLVYDFSRPLWEQDPRILNPYAEMPPLRTWGRMGERPALPLVGLVTIDAKEKQGKSFCTYALLLPLMTGKRYSSFEPLARPKRVVIFDTEMSALSLQPRVRALYRSIDSPQDSKDVILVPLLGVAPGDMWRTVEEMTAAIEPDIVVLDHILNFIADYNSPQETAPGSENRMGVPSASLSRVNVNSAAPSVIVSLALLGIIRNSAPSRLAV